MNCFQLTIRIVLLSAITMFAPASLAVGAQTESETQTEIQTESETQTTEIQTVEIEEIPEVDESKLPEIAKDIGIDSKINAFINFETGFNDEQNNFVKIGQFFDTKHPVMLSFNYSNCPKLCSVQLENMISCLRQVDLDVGDDFEVVSVSIDPLEQSSRARQTKDKYVKQYNRIDSEYGFHFLVGDRDNIAKLAGECGFRYKYVKRQKLYSHLPCFILISPNGKIVRYIHGLDYDPPTMKRALVEASEGRIGSPINRLSYGLGCYLFDESTGKYTAQAMVFMRLGGLITIAILLFTLIPYWFFRRGQNQINEQSEPTDIVNDKLVSNAN